MEMKALVTGGAGFIGSNIVQYLVNCDWDVTVLDNLASGYRENLPKSPRVQFCLGDIRNPELVAGAMDGVQVVFHLAASVGNTRSIEKPIEDSDVNVLGTLQILESARNFGVRKVVYSSSAGIFGELKTLPISEDHPIDPDSPYGTSKLAGEKMCLVYSKLYDLEAICLRYFNVYGINQRYDAYGNVIPIFAHRYLRDQPLIIYGDGEQTRDFVNVDDVVQANYLAAISEGVSGAFNIASGTRITINRLTELISETADVKVDVEYGPPRKGDVRHSLADIAAARTALGYDPKVSMESGLREFLSWAKKEMI